MKMSYKSLLKFGCFILVGIFILSGCKSTHRKYKVQRNGPPPHAPAHGYHKNFSYYYYPSSYVYYDADRDLYFYMEASVWRSGSSLPSFIRIDSGEVIVVKVDSDKPYNLFKYHKHKYPPGQVKTYPPGQAKVKLGQAKGKRKMPKY
jgi:hypothetical protein